MFICGGGGGETTAAAAEAAQISKKIDKELVDDLKKRERSLRILILGTGDAGKSTVLKQLKLLYGADFSPLERRDFATTLVANVVATAKLLVAQMAALGIAYGDDGDDAGGGGGGGGGGGPGAREGVEAAAARVAEFEHAPGAAAPEALGEAVEVLWRDPGVQKCAKRGNEFQLLDSCEFLMTHAREILAPGYTPTNDHILRARSVTTAVSETKLRIKGSAVSFFDVGGQKRFRAKWAPFFDDVSAIIFVSSLACYDQALEEDANVNRMVDSVKAFSCICNHTVLTKIPIILFLNKSDIFSRKVKESPIQNYFPEYNDGPSTAAGSSFFLKQFLKANRNAEKQITSHFTWATDSAQVQKILAEVADLILAGNLENAGLTF
ncbi:guanine nucleotide binding protein, alpha subunit [Zopfochytrium polystomum]|nr:guanine nucleotide binding protein, alpha subunit [Zopfochytrium polystomum]